MTWLGFAETEFMHTKHKNSYCIFFYIASKSKYNYCQCLVSANAALSYFFTRVVVFAFPAVYKPIMF